MTIVLTVIKKNSNNNSKDESLRLKVSMFRQAGDLQEAREDGSVRTYYVLVHASGTGVT